MAALPCSVLIDFHFVACQPERRLTNRGVIDFEISLRLTASTFDCNNVREYEFTTKMV